MMNWLRWAPLVAASLHIFEEFVFPGGFAAWDRSYRPQYEKSIASWFHIIINGLLLVLCYDAATLGPTPLGVFLWLTVASLLATNGIWHAYGAFKTRTYSPGMITGLALYVPLAIIGYVTYVRSGLAPPPMAALALALGASYQLWIGKAIHRWRLRRARA